MARQLAVSVATVRTHVRGIHPKRDGHNKPEAMLEARERGLLA